jgi:hypothetical protein
MPKGIDCKEGWKYREKPRIEEARDLRGLGGE